MLKRENLLNSFNQSISAREILARITGDFKIKFLPIVLQMLKDAHAADKGVLPTKTEESIHKAYEQSINDLLHNWALIIDIVDYTIKKKDGIGPWYVQINKAGNTGSKDQSVKFDSGDSKSTVYIYDQLISLGFIPSNVPGQAKLPSNTIWVYQAV